MLHATRRGRLSRSVISLAATAATAVGAVGLAVVAAPGAQADVDAGATFTWGVSDYVRAAPGTFSFNIDDFVGSDGATVDPTTKTVTFSAGTGHTDLGTHETEVDYQGTIQFGYTGRYLFDFSDPSVIVDDEGNGKLVADVDWSITGGDSGSTDDVTLTTFASDDDAWDGFDLRATPAWTGAVPAGTTYEVTTGGGGTTVDQEALDGASWAPELVEALPLSVRAFFFKTSTTATQELKAPASFTAEVPGPRVAVGKATYADDSVSIPVTGTGFTGAVNPGDAGVYVGLAPAGGLPDVSSTAGMGSFATAAWIGTGSIVDGSFATTLNAPADKLDRTQSYSIYTWQAHSHSNTTQDTETPVDIDWSALGVTTVKPVVTAPSVAYGAAGSVRVSVPGATGTVTLTGLGAARTATLANGAATFAVPAGTAAGFYGLAASYGGDSRHFPTSTDATFTIAKAKPVVTASWAKKPKAGKKNTVKKAVLVVRASGPAGVPGPTGTVTVKVVSGKKHVVLEGKPLHDGKVRVKLNKKKAKKLHKRTWKAKAVYSGDSSFTSATSTAKVKVKKFKK